MDWKTEYMESLIALSVILYIVYLIYEKLYIKKIRSDFKHIIHVNGTRGKSTVCRLIDAGLREAGLFVLTKTTGTSPRIIHTDGHETEIKRRGRANIREQSAVMKLGAKEKAEILVVECMAVKPEYQLVSQNDILMADIGVITNVRLDHQDEMGYGLINITNALGSSIPKNGVLFTADSKAYIHYKRLEQKYNTKVCLADDRDTIFQDIDFEENVSLAWEVCRYLGVEKNIAIKGMKKYKKDPGALEILHIRNMQSTKITFINAMAANDPDSTLMIYRMLGIDKDDNYTNRILLINNRIDRADRMKQYIDFIKLTESLFDQIWVAGGFKNIMRRKILKSGVKPERVVMLEDISRVNNLKEETLIFGVGNMGGYGESIINFFKGYSECYA